MPDIYTLTNAILLLLLVATALAVGVQRNLFASTMLMCIFSLLCASLFVCLDAVDVAFTEAAVGAGVATLLFLSTLALTNYKERGEVNHRGAALLLTLTCGLLLFYGLSDLPAFGAADAPVHTLLSPHYLRGAMEQTGIPNAVTAVLASYRGHDTLGEVAVIFTSLTAVLTLLGRGRQSTDPDTPSARHKQVS